MTPELSSRKKVVLITGAAGGLGQELARQFLAQDWRVAAQYHHSVLHQSDPNLLQISGDITQACQVNQMIQSVLLHWRAVDVLVNNAGIAIDDPCWQVDDVSWEQQLSVNLKGAFFCCRAAAVPMANQGGGHIINIASFAGRQGSRGQSAYAAAKAGLLGLSASLARELGPDQVQVNAVLPGVLP
ncbi:MAG TPA: SDR family oxidoreductase, partial [Verrucomicrobiota bacterium]|nr:SDR family oxidoreductase [Verrucomicrobiota bacterium]